MIGDWQEDYNLRRTHSALGMKTSAVFAAEWTTAARRPAAESGSSPVRSVTAV